MAQSVAHALSNQVDAGSDPSVVWNFLSLIGSVILDPLPDSILEPALCSHGGKELKP